MTDYTYNTGNPIGSTDVRDGVDNLKSFDVLLNSTDDTYQDRLGNTVPTAAGAIKRLGPVVVSWTFTTGGTLNYPNEAALNPVDGNYYGWTGAFPKVVAPGTNPTLPGSGYVPRTDVALRNDLGVITKLHMTVSTMIADTALEAGDIVETLSYHDGWVGASSMPVGGNRYEIVAGGTGTDDGGSFIDLANGLQAKGLFPTGLWIEQFGAKPNQSGYDSYQAIQNAYNKSANFNGSIWYLNAGPGNFYYSTTLLIPHVSGICPCFIGAGSLKTNLIKTSNATADIAASTSINALIAQYYRGPVAYCYQSNITGVHFKADTGVAVDYGVHAQLSARFRLEDVDITGVTTAYWSSDVWMAELNKVHVHYCTTGFKVAVTGTSFNLTNCWVEWCSDKAYDITGVVYSEWSNCGADHVYDTGNPTIAKVPYLFTNCDGIVLNGCSAEDCHQLVKTDNSRIKINVFRCGSIKLGASQTLFNWTNNSAVECDSCSTSAAGASSAITAQAYDSTSYVAYKNCRWQIANSGVPSNPHQRNSALTTNMTIDAMGLQSLVAKVNGNTGSYVGIAALKSGSGIRFISAHLLDEDNQVTFASNFVAFANISTNPASPTVLGTLYTQAGVASTNLVGYIVTDSAGKITLGVRFSGPRASARMSFIYSTSSNW